MDEAVGQLETLIRAIGQGERDVHLQSARAQLRACLRAICGLDEDLAGDTLAELIEQATSASMGRPEAASVILRCMAVKDLLPENNSTNQIHRKIVSLVRAGTPEICEQYFKDDKVQTFEVVNKLKSVFNTILQEISSVAQIPAQIEPIIATRQRATAILNDKAVLAALSAYDGREIASRVEAIYALLSDIRKIQDTAFPHRILNLQNLVLDGAVYCEVNINDFTDKFYGKFLSVVEEVVARLDTEARERFVCDLAVGVGNEKQLSKRYPINQIGREFTIIVPMVNTGPGYARAVTFIPLIDNENIIINSAEVSYGDIAHGAFAFAIDAITGEPAGSVQLTIEATWGRAASADRQSRTFEFQIIAQPTDIDWAKLEQSDPYSTSVAVGDEFVGRQGKLASLLGRLTKDKMESSYITGQKRIGKSSLAKKIEEEIAKTQTPYCYGTTFLEWGEYSNQDPIITLRNLGESLSDSMIACLPMGTVIPTLDFTGSLAPLSRLADLLRRSQPNQRCIFILDEFDELHPDLYRLGTLADTFFSNLRSLTAKPNVGNSTFNKPRSTSCVG
jgi:hypothetical protein